jgi:two-component system, cell cycle sensor histidine kinase and response regulator CckA
MSDEPAKILLVDDDEDDYIILRDLIGRISNRRYQLEWVDNFEAGLAAVHRGEHDICLLDYRLGERTGLELLRESQPFSNRPPMILLTGQGDHEIDIEAMKAGAAEYLIKGQFNPDMLERTIRYAIEGQRARQNLRRERDLISRIMVTSPVGIVVANRAGKITFANQRAEHVLGLTKEIVEAGTASVLDWRLLEADGAVREEEALPLKQILKSGLTVQDARHVIDFSDHRRVLLSVNATPLFDAAGKIDGMIVTVEDITDRQALESQLRQSQKMECVGQLAAGVAHDINNILTIIQGHAGILLNSLPANADTVRSLKQISAASERAAGFIKHLLTFSRKQVFQTKILDLNTVFRNMESMLPRMLGEQITLETRYGAGMPLVAADTSMIEQIIMNLMVNARDAMPKGGKLLIETAAVKIGADHVRQNHEARAGDFICLTVTDTGCGMERKILERIFEPFFTTKAVGEGTGIGLATVYGIIKQHNGWAEVESEVNVGTTFKIFLPAVSAGAVVPPAVTPKSETINGGRETILIVEDESSLLDLVKAILERYHYRILTASSGAAALRVWDEHNGQIDLLLTDMIMPGGVTGSDLAAELKSRRPGLKVIFTSGYSAELVGKDLGLESAAFLPKPYQPQQVARLVRDILGPAPAICRETAFVPKNGSCLQAV